MSIKSLNDADKILTRRRRAPLKAPESGGQNARRAWHIQIEREELFLKKEQFFYLAAILDEAQGDAQNCDRSALQCVT